MKGKISHIWRVVIAISLVMSLGLVFAAPVAAQPPMANASTYYPSEVFVCEEYPVTVRIYNNDSFVIDDVIIDLWGGGSSATILDPGEKWVGDICPGEYKEATWMAKCTGPGTANFNYSSSYLEGTLRRDLMVSGSFGVNQICKLEVEITEPWDGNSYHLG